MPMDRERYPKEWKQMAAAIKEAAGWKCQKCGKQCRRPGEPFDTHRNTLTVAHLNHTPEDMRPENLLAMCAPCHLRYDAKHHAETRRNRKMKNDTISRQETLEHLRKRLIETAFNNVGYECDAGKVFEDASKRLDVWMSEVPSVQQEPRWIPCSERLPKPYEYCLWTTTDGRVIYHHCDGLFSNYTAWMPLPEPYREGEQDE